MENEESVIYLAVLEGDDLVALGFTQLYPLFASVSMHKLWILYDLYVVPEARRQGVAKALLDRARQLARDTGAGEIMLQTARDNHAAQALYESVGFERDETFYTYYLQT